MSSVRLRGAEALFTALGSNNLALRLGTLQAVIRNPHKALLMGCFEGRDVVDQLIRLVSDEQHPLQRQALLRALEMFNDARVLACFSHLFATTRVPEEVQLTGLALPAQPQSFWLPWLMQNESACHARVAAQQLAAAGEGLDSAAQIRSALLGFGDAPWLCAANLREWTGELGGRYGASARHCLESQGLSTLRELCSCWVELGPNQQRWLLHWGGKHWPEQLQPLLCSCLSSECSDTVLAALTVVASLDAALRPSLDSLLNHPDIAVRCAAIRLNGACTDWRAQTKHESDPRILTSYLEGPVRLEGIAALPDLCVYLGFADPAVRSAAVDGLIALGENIAAHVRPLVSSADTPTRVAAAQVLLGLGKDDWLRQDVLQ